MAEDDNAEIQLPSALLVYGDDEDGLNRCHWCRMPGGGSEDICPHCGYGSYLEEHYYTFSEENGYGYKNCTIPVTNAVREYLTRHYRYEDWDEEFSLCDYRVSMEMCEWNELVRSLHDMAISDKKDAIQQQATQNFIALD